MSTPEDRYGHLRPVPSVSGTEALAPEPAEQGTPGLTAPHTRGHSGRFVTDVVVELGYLSRERVEQAIGEARVAARSPEALMVEQGILSADKLSRAIAERYGLDHVDLNIYHVDMGAANLVNVQTARRFHAVPVGYVDSETLLVAMSDPANVLAVDDIKMMTGLNCRVAVAAEVDIEALISRLNSLESAVSEAVSEDEAEADLTAGDVTELRESADDAPVIKLVYSILGQAVNEGASDVHFEIEDKDMRVRFRVDGVLNEAARVPRRMVSGSASPRTDASPSTSTTAGSTSASSPSRPSAARERRSGSSTSPRRSARSTSSACSARPGRASPTPTTSPTAPSSSPVRPGRASRRRCTRRCRS